MIFYCMIGHILFIHLSPDEHLTCSRLLAAVNAAAVNMGGKQLFEFQLPSLMCRFVGGAANSERESATGPQSLIQKLGVRGVSEFRGFVNLRKRIRFRCGVVSNTYSIIISRLQMVPHPFQV